MSIKKLLCLGDSLTEGYEVDPSVRWTSLLSDKLNIEIINAGISGDTTAGMLARCECLIVNHKPSHLILLGGTNDLWFGLKDEFILSNIHAIRRQARYHKVIPIIGIPTSVMNINELNMVHENYSECIRSFQNTLINYCNEDDQVYIDFSKDLKVEHFIADGVHPNKEGQKVLMQNAEEVLGNLI